MKKFLLGGLALLSVLSYRAESSESSDPIQACRLHVGLSSLSFSFQDLGAIDTPLVSGDGSTIVGNKSSKIFIITSTEKSLLDSEDSSAYGINHDGTIIVGQKRSHACVWVKMASGYSCTLLRDGSQARGVNDDGSTIVGMVFNCDSALIKPCKWQRNGGGHYEQSLSDVGNDAAGWLNGTDSKASIAAGTLRPDGHDWVFQQACSQTPKVDGTSGEEFSVLNTENSPYGEAIAVSADGKVIAGKSQYGFRDIPVGFGAKRFPLYQACYWTGNGSEPKSLGFSGRTGFLDYFLYFQSQALACNGDGAVIVGSTSLEQYNGFEEDFDAFVWTEKSAMRSIQQLLSEDGVDLKGWILTKATGISRDGKEVVGVGVFNDEARAWKATMPTVTPALSYSQRFGSFFINAVRGLLPASLSSSASTAQRSGIK